MRLERIFTHRVVRLLQLTLPILVIVLVAIPAWNYYSRRVQKAGSPRVGIKLPSGVSVRTEGFTYSITEGARTKFTVRAKQSLGYQDDKYMLQDVDVTVYGATEQEPARTIHGKNCTYNQATNDFTCTGDVNIHLDENTIVRTENLIYSHQDGIVTAPEHATIERQGSHGKADRFEYEMNSGLLKLDGNVNIQTADHDEIETGAASFHQKENWTTMLGGVLIKSPNGWIRGSTGRADLQPGTFRPKTVTVEGNVTGESRSATRNEAWKLRAGWLEAVMSEAGTAEHVKTRGDAEFEKLAGDPHQLLSGSEIDADLKDGKVDVIEARQNARMVFGPDQSLESSRIWTTPAGTVQTADSSVLKVGDSTIQGREFVIENTEDVVTFTTIRRATLKKADGQESSSDQTRARFENRTNMLLELVQRGSFEFRTPQYQGRAQSGRFEEGGTVITLEGSPVVNDAEKRVEAAKIQIDQKDNSFVATTKVSTLLKNSSTPGKGQEHGNDVVRVKADRAEGGSDSMLYTGSVQLWRGEAYIKADRLSASGQGQQNARVHAEATSGGTVQSFLQNVRATSDSLDYDEAGGKINYRGRVRALKQDLLLETPDLTVNMKDQDVSEIVAAGGVVMTRADQRGSGEHAVYDAPTDVLTLTGKNAQVRDKEHGLVQGPTLIVKDKGHLVTVESGPGERTITRHSVKNDETRSSLKTPSASSPAPSSKTRSANTPARSPKK